MRIALLHYTLPPVIGGVERVVAQQAAALTVLGHEVMLLDAAGWRAAVDARGGGGPWEAVVIHNVMTMPFDLKWRRELAGWVERCPAVRWLNWVHDVALMNPAYAGMSEEVRGELAQMPVGLQHVAVSAARAAEFVGAVGLGGESVEVIPNGLSLEEWVGLTPRLRERLEAVGWWGADLVLLHPARLVRRKRIELGLEVVAALGGRG